MVDVVGRGLVRIIDDRIVVEHEGISVEVGLPGEGSFTALDLLAMSLAGCVATYIYLVFKKMRIDFDVLAGVEGSVVKRSDEDTVSKAIVKVRLRSKDDKVLRAVDYAVRTCSVGLLLSRAGVDVVKEYVI